MTLSISPQSLGASVQKDDQGIARPSLAAGSVNLLSGDTEVVNIFIVLIFFIVANSAIRHRTED